MPDHLIHMDWGGQGALASWRPGEALADLGVGGLSAEAQTAAAAFHGVGAGLAADRPGAPAARN